MRPAAVLVRQLLLVGELDLVGAQLLRGALLGGQLDAQTRQLLLLKAQLVLLRAADRGRATGLKT